MINDRRGTWTLEVDVEDYEDVSKLWHYAVSGNRRVHIDWTPYEHMTERDFALWLQAGRPSALEVCDALGKDVIAPINSNTLREYIKFKSHEVDEDYLMQSPMVDEDEEEYLARRDRAIKRAIAARKRRTTNEMSPPARFYESRGSAEAVENAIIHRIRHKHLDLIRTYGISKVMAAVEDAASFYSSMELDEIGSSDVSIWVNNIIKDLESGMYDDLAESKFGGTAARLREARGGDIQGWGEYDPVERVFNMIKEKLPTYSNITKFLVTGIVQNLLNDPNFKGELAKTKLTFDEVIDKFMAKYATAKNESRKSHRRRVLERAPTKPKHAEGSIVTYMYGTVGHLKHPNKCKIIKLYKNRDDMEVADIQDCKTNQEFKGILLTQLQLNEGRLGKAAIIPNRRAIKENNSGVITIDASGNVITSGNMANALNQNGILTVNGANGVTVTIDANGNVSTSGNIPVNQPGGPTVQTNNGVTTISTGQGGTVVNIDQNGRVTTLGGNQKGQTFTNGNQTTTIFNEAKKKQKAARSPYAIGMAVAKKEAGITRKHDIPKKVITRAHEIAKSIEAGPLAEKLAIAENTCNRVHARIKRLQQALAEHKRTFARRVMEGKETDMFNIGYGIKGETIINQINKLKIAEGRANRQLAAVMQESIAAYIKHQERVSDYQLLSETKNNSPYGVIYTNDQGIRVSKFFETRRMRNYWVQLNEQLRNAIVIEPEHFSLAIKKVKSRKG